ncbi:hypothetical protein C5167_037146 [Papaver somniferum]|uniref:Sugar phosphate transporter domain-containing protein n=1 Tax=Papaver somniferum TaxID=3469 RepID=A0A4Y7I5X2_PAPSO|nr:hypothetical protein C5167_037146 [Papaver somniferum]
MPTGGVNLDSPDDLVIERQLLLDDTTQNVDKFGISNRGEHNVVVLDQLTSPLRREFGNRSMKSLNSEAVDLEAGADDKERDKQTRSIKLVKDPNQALLSGLAYCISSCSMILINKYVLSSYDFNAGISLMLYQNLVSVVIVSTLSFFGLISTEPLTWKLVRVWLPVNFIFVGMLITSLFSLKYINVAMVTVLKNVTNVITALGEMYLFKKSHDSRVWAALFLMIAVDYELRFPSLSMNRCISFVSQLSNHSGCMTRRRFPLQIISAVSGGVTDISFHAVGYTWQILNCFLTASYSVATSSLSFYFSIDSLSHLVANFCSYSLCVIFLIFLQLTLRRVMDTVKQVTKSGNLNEFTMVLLNNTLSLPLGLLLIFLFNEVDYLFDTPLLRMPTFWLVMTSSGFLGLAISFTSMWFLHQTGATTYSLVGSLNKIPLSVAGILLFHVPTSFQNFTSILFGLLAGVFFARAKMREKS